MNLCSLAAMLLTTWLQFLSFSSMVTAEVFHRVETAADNVTYFSSARVKGMHQCMIRCLVSGSCNGFTFSSHYRHCNMASCVNPANMVTATSASADYTYLMHDPAVNTTLARGTL